MLPASLRYDDNPDLVQAQLRAFHKQVPILYAILLVNTCTLAYAHLNLAPAGLSMGVPAILAVVCVLRTVQWVRLPQINLSPEAAIAKLRSTVVLAGVLGLAFVTWALLLFPHGDAYSQGHVAFFIGITVVSCIFCLMHLRPAALLLTAVVVVPFSIFFMLTGRPTFVAISLNMLLVAATMIYILVVYSRDFATMVNSQTALVAKHEELQALSEENLRLAHIDSLTGLPNRRRFFAHLTSVLERANGTGERFAVGVIDLDGFKPINDVHGHGMGDRVLIETGRRMLECVGDRGFVARLGGDEFGLIIEGDLSDDELQAVCTRLCEVIDAPIRVASLTLHVTGSAGIAAFPQAGTDAAVLFDRADYALYYAKEKQPGKPVVFSAHHETAIRRDRLVQQHLRSADLDAELHVAFHPIVNVDDRSIIAFEALARWQSPHLGRVSPEEFIRIAEHNSLVSKLTVCLLEKALAEAKRWPDHIALSFNLSAHDISSPDGIGRIAALIKASGIAPERVEFEVTETSLIVDYDRAIRSLNTLKALGARISLDDFGTGHSSLSQLNKLPIDKIKIDRSFIRDLGHDAQHCNIVKTVLVLSQSLGLPCVVEGVETAEQVRILLDLRAQHMQGNHFSEPLPPEDVPAFIAHWEAPRRTQSAA